MSRWRTVLFVWLIAGAVLFGHDAATGGGVVGVLLAWQLDALGVIVPSVTYLALAVVLIGAPGFLLLRGQTHASPPSLPAARRIQWIACISLAACLGVFSVMAFQQATGVPNEDATIVRFTIFGPVANAALPNSARVVLQGTPQPEHEVAYDEVALGKVGHAWREPHRLVPLTGAGWTPSQPVYFVADLQDATQLPASSLPGATLRSTPPGIIVQDAIPGWLRRAFAERGVTLADDARLHTADWRAERNGWFAVAVMTALAAALCLLGGIAMRGRNTIRT